MLRPLRRHRHNDAIMQFEPHIRLFAHRAIVKLEPGVGVGFDPFKKLFDGQFSIRQFGGTH